MGGRLAKFLEMRNRAKAVIPGMTQLLSKPCPMAKLSYEWKDER